jgi:hypothetical protein
MAGRAYWLKVLTLGIAVKAGKPCPVTIPAGAILACGGKEDSGMIKCAWDGKDVHVFAVDPQERGERVWDVGE